MILSKQKGFSPIIIIIGVVVLLVTAIIGFLVFKPKSQEQSNWSSDTPYDNTKIMYGYKDYDDYLKSRPEKIKEADEDYVANVNGLVKSGDKKSLADAAQQTCDKGYDLWAKKDKKTAMKRFNQAWLLDHNQPCIYAGYGFSLAQSSQLEQSFEMYEKALSLANPKSPNDAENSWWILAEYAEPLAICYITDNKRTDCLDKAMNNLTKSLAIKDNAKAHRVLAIINYYKKDYKEAWNQVHLAIDGGLPIENFGGIIDNLKKEMPDPQGKIQ